MGRINPKQLLTLTPANLIGVPQAIGTLQYGPLTLALMRLEEFKSEPVYDSIAGVDYLYNHVTLTARCIFNPQVGPTATVPNPVPNLGPFILPPGANGFTIGDRIGVSLAAVRSILAIPRQQLIVTIGSDVVVRSPQYSTNGVPAKCDAKNGPLPTGAPIVLEVQGTKSAVVLFRIETWIGGQYQDGSDENCVLSNRWEVSSEVDDVWLTRLTTHGVMHLRTDILQSFETPPSADIFRTSCLPPVPSGFFRERIHIRESADNSTLEWWCIDQERMLNLGSNCPAMTVEGQCTTGSELPFKTVGEFVRLIGQVPSAVSGATIIGAEMGGPIGAAFGAAIGAAVASLSFMPSVRAEFQIRCKGNKQSNRYALAALALSIAMDRFKFFGGIIGLGGFLDPGSANAPFLVSCYCTQSIESKTVEVRGSFLQGVLATANAFVDPTDFGALMNMQDQIVMTSGIASNSGLNPAPPNANASRGTFIGPMLATALQKAFALPTNNALSYLTQATDVTFE
jgi:hypothetical protein